MEMLTYIPNAMDSCRSFKFTSVNATVPLKVVKRGQKFPPALFSGWQQIRQASKAMNFNWHGQSHTNMYNYCYVQLYQLN